MGLHDIETMNLVRAALDEVDPSILLYGEGWTAGATPLPREQQAIKINTAKLDERMAVFSDDIRDGIKGGVFDGPEPGFVTGAFRRREDVKFGITASVFHLQIDYSRITYAESVGGPWAIAPSQTVTYVSAHDNLSLWDKFQESRPDVGESEWLQFNKMAALLVLTSQGIPFFQAGEEFARTKYGDHNSYQSPDSINQLEWEKKTQYNDLVEYYKGLIALRKAEPSFRLRTADDIAETIVFLDTEVEVIAYTLNTDKTLLVAVNADDTERTLSLPASGWDVLVDGERAGVSAIDRIDGNVLTMPARTGFVLLQSNQGIGRAWWALVTGGIVAIICGAAAAIYAKRKK
jgi:pullulanase